MKKLVFVIVILSFIQFPIFSQEKSKSYKLYLYLASGAGSISGDSINNLVNNEVLSPIVLGSTYSSALSTALSLSSVNLPDYTIPTKHYQIGGEYRFSPKIGFGFGVSQSSYSLTNIIDPLRDIVSALIFDAQSQNLIENTVTGFPEGFDYKTLLYASYAFIDTSVPKRIQTNTVDISLNWHFLGDKTFDPYIGIGGSYGYCSSSFIKCTAPKGSAKLGFQINMSSLFFFLQGEAHYLFIWEKAGRGGLGVRF